MLCYVLNVYINIHARRYVMICIYTYVCICHFFYDFIHMHAGIHNIGWMRSIVSCVPCNNGTMMIIIIVIYYYCPGYFVLKCVASSHLKCCGDESLPVYQLIGV